MTELAHATAASSSAPEAFFARWVDHATWSDWSPDTQWVRLDGPVRTGTTGRLKPKGGPSVRFVISACSPPHEDTDTSHLPGARLVFRHTASRVGGATELAADASISGPLSRVWALTLGRGFRTSAQADLDRLVRLVEDVA
jgi:hypothetical protein